MGEPNDLAPAVTGANKNTQPFENGSSSIEQNAAAQAKAPAMPRIRYSRGKSTYDNKPSQREVSSFEAFADAVLADRAGAKGKAYVCAPMANGQHRNPEKHPGVAPWRQKHLVQPRAFLPFDFDGFDTPETFEKLRQWLQRFKGFAYTTASHKPEAPRCRIMLAQSRETDREEGIRLGQALQAMMERDLGEGRMTFDESVYRAEQSLYTPLHEAETFRFEGEPVDVDAVLAAAPAADGTSDDKKCTGTTERGSRPVPTAPERLAGIAREDLVLGVLELLGLVRSELGGGKYAVECPCRDAHSSESNETSTVYYLPHTGGYQYGGFHCLHDHCRDRPQEDFFTALGLTSREVRAAQRGHSLPRTGGRYQGYFEVSEQGVMHIGKDKRGDDKPPLWVCAPLHIRAMTRDAKSGEWGRLLEWHDKDGVLHRWAMPSELLQGDATDVRRELVRRGLSVNPSARGRELLSAYLQVCEVEARARCVTRLGWHNGVFMTPNEPIGESEELVVFQSAYAIEPAYAVAGTVEQWRENIGRLAAGNSRLVFALSVAFAGALAEVVGEDSGGFHLRGASSSGKTTALKVAASVWGNPDTYLRRWRATTNGLEGLAAVHNDGVLILDELSQLDPKEAGEAAYLLANGQGKTRASRAGVARQAARWRLLFLSSGEESLAALMSRVGRRLNAGQEIRLADIEADAGAGMGAFETLHDQPTPAALALALNEAATKCHGAVGVEWLRCLVADQAKLAEHVAAGIRHFVAEVVPKNASGQVLRVARRFALVAMAGELASGCDLVGPGYGLTGWDEGEAIEAARKCFVAWLEGFGGAGNREDRALFSQVRAFFEAHGASRFARLDGLDSPEMRPIINRAGFIRLTKGGGREYLVLPEAFEREVCEGFDEKAAKRTLVAAGWIIPPAKAASGHLTQRIRIPNEGLHRCYVFGPRAWEGDK